MKYPAGKEEYHDIYPEFNSEHEGTIVHKERSGASRSAASALLATVVAVAFLATVLNLNVLRRAVIRPMLLSVTETSAEVNVFSRLEDSDVSYPILYELYPYTADESPVSSSGKLLLTDQDLSGSDTAPSLTGEITDPRETLVFENLESGRPYLLVFRTGSGSDGGLRDEALLIPLKQRPLKLPSTPAPVTPAPVTPVPITPEPVTPEPVTPEPPPVTPEPGQTDDNPMFYPGEIIIEPPKKPVTAKPGKTPYHPSPWGPTP